MKILKKLYISSLTVLQNGKKIYSKINLFLLNIHKCQQTNTQHSKLNKHKNMITYQSNHYSLNVTSPSQKHLEITIYIAKSRMTSFEYTLLTFHGYLCYLIRHKSLLIPSNPPGIRITVVWRDVHALKCDSIFK